MVPLTADRLFGEAKIALLWHCCEKKKPFGPFWSAWKIHDAKSLENVVKHARLKLFTSWLFTLCVRSGMVIFFFCTVIGASRYLGCNKQTMARRNWIQMFFTRAIFKECFWA